MLKLINVFSGQPTGAALPLIFHEVMGMDHIAEIAIIIAAMLLNEELVFFEDGAGDAMRDGGPISFEAIRAELKLESLCLQIGRPYVDVVKYFVPFASYREGANYPVIPLWDAKPGDLERFAELPREHPYNLIGLVAWGLEHPVLNDWGPLGPDHEDLDKRTSTEAI